MKLSQLAKYNLVPPVTLYKHEEWMINERPYTQEAIDFIARELAKVGRDRRGSFSASGLGSCPRQQQFTYLGLAKLPQSAQRMAVLANGTFVHLRLQAAGLSAGWLAEAEVPIPENVTGLKGTMDGTCYEGSVLEAKSINGRAFRFVQEDPKDEHVYQAETYLVVTGREKAVILYENKDDQSLKEHTVHHDDATDNKIIGRALELQGKTHDRELFPMLPKCLEGKGWQFDYCDYKDRCPLIQSFNQAVKTAEQEHDNG